MGANGAKEAKDERDRSKRKMRCGGGVFSAAKQDDIMCLLHYIWYDVSHRGENGHLKNSLCLTTWCRWHARECSILCANIDPVTLRWQGSMCHSVGWGGSVPAKYFLTEKRKKQLEYELVSDLQPFVNSQRDSQYNVRWAHAEESSIFANYIRLYHSDYATSQLAGKDQQLFRSRATHIV